MTRTLCFATVVAALLAASAATAQPVQSFGDVGLRLNVGDRVRVVGTDGQRFEGAVRSLSPTTLVVAGPNGTRGFTVETTARIARRGDGLASGLVIGAVPGFALGVAFVNGFSDNPEPVSSYLLAGGVLGLAGAGLGALVDALHEGEKMVYVAPGVQAAVVPLVSRRSVGVAAAWRW